MTLLLNVVVTALATDTLTTQLVDRYEGQPKCEVSAVGTNVESVGDLARREYVRRGCDDSPNAFTYGYRRRGNVYLITYTQKESK
jgi:hypothetical protein